MLMIKFLPLLLIILSFNAKSSVCNDYEKLSSEQKYRLEFSYHYGLPDDLGYTLAAIALVESQAGKYKINSLTKDYGLHQINEKTIFSILGTTSYWKRQEMITKVVTDDNLSAYLAITVLKHFRQARGGSWKKMVMSYNIGNKTSEDALQRGIEYYSKISQSVRLLKSCMRVS